MEQIAIAEELFNKFEEIINPNMPKGAALFNPYKIYDNQKCAITYEMLNWLRNEKIINKKFEIVETGNFNQSFIEVIFKERGGYKMTTNELSEIDIKIIKASLNAHLHQCEEFIKLDNQVKTFTSSERIKVEEKIKHMKELLNRL